MTRYIDEPKDTRKLKIRNMGIWAILNSKSEKVRHIGLPHRLYNVMY